MNDDAQGPAIILRFHTRKDCPRLTTFEALRARWIVHTARDAALSATDDRARLPSG
jgi:hypothetical protein